MSNELNQVAANHQGEYKFRSAEIVGFGAADQKAFSAGVQILEKDPILESANRMANTARDSLIAGAAAGLLGGPLAAVTVAGIKLTHDIAKAGEDKPDHGLKGGTAKADSGKKGWSMFT